MKNNIIRKELLFFLKYSKFTIRESGWIAIFEKRWDIDGTGERVKHYYPTESVGIATGMLIAALHRAGLATLVGDGDRRHPAVEPLRVVDAPDAYLGQTA